MNERPTILKLKDTAKVSIPGDAWEITMPNGVKFLTQDHRIELILTIAGTAFENNSRVPVDPLKTIMNPEGSQNLEQIIGTVDKKLFWHSGYRLNTLIELGQIPATSESNQRRLVMFLEPTSRADKLKVLERRPDFDRPQRRVTRRAAPKRDAGSEQIIEEIAFSRSANRILGSLRKVGLNHDEISYQEIQKLPKDRFNLKLYSPDLLKQAAGLGYIPEGNLSVADLAVHRMFLDRIKRGQTPNAEVASFRKVVEARIKQLSTEKTN